MGIVKVVKRVYMIKQRLHSQPNINIFSHPHAIIWNYTSPNQQTPNNYKIFNYSIKTITPQRMRSIYTNKIHNNPHSHQKNATKNYQDFNGLKYSHLMVPMPAKIIWSALFTFPKFSIWKHPLKTCFPHLTCQ